MQNLHHLRVMSKRWKRVLLLACGILVLLLVWQLFREREPSYQGSTLSEWVDLVGPAYLWQDSDEEVQAIRAIGTNAIPTILKWISYEPSPLRNKIRDLVERLPSGLRPNSISFAEDRATSAVTVFRVLGPEARSAIPELTRLVLTASDDRRAYRCFGALLHLGPEALPSMLTLVTNRWPGLRVATIAMLPAFGTNAQVAIPALRPLLADPDLDVRMITTNALLRIAPEVLTNAPPQ